MTDQTTPSTASTAFDHHTTLAIALELSGKSWELGAVVPGVTRRPRRRLDPRDMAGLLRQVERWKAEATTAGRTIERVVLAYEAGRDGFWIARYLLARGIETHIMHPASIPVDRKKRRAKTDRLDTSSDTCRAAAARVRFCRACPGGAMTSRLERLK